MPLFLVVRCVECAAFQVQQKKKVPKWSCPLCQTKQSLLRVYHESDLAKDCRPVAQRLNELRGEADDLVVEQRALRMEERGDDFSGPHSLEGTRLGPSTERPSMWATFVDADEDGDGADDSAGYFMDAPPPQAKRKRARGASDENTATDSRRSKVVAKSARISRDSSDELGERAGSVARGLQPSTKGQWPSQQPREAAPPFQPLVARDKPVPQESLGSSLRDKLMGLSTSTTNAKSSKAPPADSKASTLRADPKRESPAGVLPRPSQSNSKTQPTPFQRPAVSEWAEFDDGDEDSDGNFF
ncbi:hypothetical protein DFJ73DRAFT_825414 [Zopfochytrium polystomum]|nr:hypothetical protein DFJ73DRAFT_825414 [Zopfochytrium polystomum]